MTNKILSLIFLPVFIISCTARIENPEANIIIDHWIRDIMDTAYYWNTKLPLQNNYNLSPSKFLKSLMYKDDRFSWIEEESTSNLKSYLLNNSKSYGFRVTLYYISRNSNLLVAEILYVQKNSPADKAGLRRGNLFDAVNNSKLTVSNYASLLDPKVGTISINTVSYDSYNGAFQQLKTVSLTAEILDQNPVAIDTLYNYNGYKIGYLLYNQFISDPGDKSLTYDKELENIFSGFKQSGINCLIIDFRFNLGGELRACLKLASLIVKNADTSKIFLKYEYNRIMDSILSSQSEKNYFIDKFSDEPNNIGSNINCLAVITSNNTASASEAIINGLRPYMCVYLIGDTTVGKNYGSISITNELKDIKWSFQPIVFKVFNCLDQSDYSNGFPPDVYMLDGGLGLVPLGNRAEKLLAAALDKITGKSVKSEIIKGEEKWPVGFRSFNPDQNYPDIPFFKLKLNRIK